MASIPIVKPPKAPAPSNYLANVVARHIVLGRPYPKKLPKIPSINNSLPAVMKHFGGLV